MARRQDSSPTRGEANLSLVKEVPALALGLDMADVTGQALGLCGSLPWGHSRRGMGAICGRADIGALFDECVRRDGATGPSRPGNVMQV